MMMKTEKTNLEMMVAEANAINAVFAEIPAKIIEKQNAENAEIISEFAKSFAVLTPAEMFKKLVCVSIPDDTKEKEIANAIFNAVSVETCKVYITETGLLSIKDSLHSVTFAEILKAKIELLGNAHADGKPTKDDRINALKYFFGDYGVGNIQCLLHKAFINERLDGMKISENAEIVKSYAEIERHYQSTKKDNPFNGNSNTKKAEMLKYIYSSIGISELKTNAYYFDGFCKMVVQMNRKAVLTVADISKAMQALLIIGRYIYNGKKFVIKDNAKILF